MKDSVKAAGLQRAGEQSTGTSNLSNLGGLSAGRKVKGKCAAQKDEFSLRPFLITFYPSGDEEEPNEAQICLLGCSGYKVVQSCPLTVYIVYIVNS